MGLHFTTVHLILRFRKSEHIIVYTLEEEDEEEEEEEKVEDVGKTKKKKENKKKNKKRRRLKRNGFVLNSSDTFSVEKVLRRRVKGQ